MRTFLILICTVALACVAGGAQEKNKSKKPAPKKSQAQSSHHVAAPGGGPQKSKGPQHVTTAAGQPAGAGGQKAKGKAKGSQQITAQGGQKTGGAAGVQKTKGGGAAVQSSTKTFKAQHFNLSNKPKPEIAAVKFQQNRRIVGSQNWQGKNYWAFRNYRPVWHDRIWWRSHFNRVVFISGGWYYWNAGWWYPAWGYAPSAYYAYDGSIYGYNGLPPDQVIANVQTALQQQGYYQSEVDGLLGPRTRAAVADYQRDHGLYITSAIDQPTLASLGMT